MILLGPAALVALIGLSPGDPPTAEVADPGPFVRAYWLLQSHGNDFAADPSHDAEVKGTLAKALGKDGTIEAPEVERLMDSSTFAKFAGADGRLDPDEVRGAIEAETPESRSLLLPAVASHADLLTTSFDLIDEPHGEAAARLGAWIAANYKPGRPLHVVVICTGNSRRSVMGATFGNVAAAYYGMPEVRFHSGGTDPSACNPRTVAALRAIGVEVEPTGAEAPRGEAGGPNPVYRLRWGAPRRPDLRGDRVLQDICRSEQPPVEFRRLDGLWRGRRRLPRRRRRGQADLDALPRPQDLRRRRLRGHQVRRAPRRHRPDPARRDAPGTKAYRRSLIYAAGRMVAFPARIRTFVPSRI